MPESAHFLIQIIAVGSDNKPSFKTAFKPSMLLCTYMHDILVPLLILNNFLYISLKATFNLFIPSDEYLDQRCPPYTSQKMFQTILV